MRLVERTLFKDTPSWLFDLICFRAEKRFVLDANHGTSPAVKMPQVHHRLMIDLRTDLRAREVRQPAFQ